MPIESFSAMIQVSAVTVCSLTQGPDKVPYLAALRGSVPALASYVIQVHGGRIATVPRALSAQETNGLVLQEVVFDIYRRCKAAIPKEDLAKVEEAIKQSQQAPRNNPSK